MSVSFAPKAAPAIASGIEGVYVHGQHVTAKDVERAHRNLTYAIEETDAALRMADIEGDTAQLAAVDMALLAGSYRAQAARRMGTGALSTDKVFYAVAMSA